MSWPSRVSQEIQRIKNDHRQQIKMKNVMLVVFATCFGTEARGAWGKCGVMAVSSLSVIQAKWDCRYEKGRNCSDDMMRDTRVTQSPSSFSAARPINSVTSSVCVCVRKHSFKPFSLRALSLCYVMLPQWRPVHDPYKKRRMPTSLHPEACQSSLKGEGPHNLLFVPLLLRKYFLNSSFSFVYFYCSYFRPWSNPVFSYLFAF